LFRQETRIVDADDAVWPA